MTEHWLRWFHGTVNDPKWRVVAMRASHAMSHRVTTRDVLAVWACMVECASQATPRGELIGWCTEDIASLLEMEQADVEAIHAAMQGKTLNGNKLIAWEKRQPKREREDPTAAERKAAQRQREAAALVGVTTSGHDTSHHVTPRGEERREEKALSVDTTEKIDTRAPPPDPPPPRAEIGTRAGQAAKALRAAGLTHVNPTHPALLRLLEAGVTDAELTDAATEAIAAGKRHIAYVCGVVEGRRRDAASAGVVNGNPKPTTGSYAYRPYVPERHRNRDGPSNAEAVAIGDIAKHLGLEKPAQPDP